MQQDSSWVFLRFQKLSCWQKMRTLDDGTSLRVGNDPGRDVTNEAAQLVWHLVMAEGGEIMWEMDDGSRMVLKAESQEATSEQD